MLSNRTLFVIGVMVLLAGLPAAGQTGAVVLRSPNGALEMSIATVRGQRRRTRAANWRTG